MSATTSSTTGAGGAGGNGTASASASTSVSTGTGMPGVCVTPIECPQPANECATATCTAGMCGIANAPAGTVTTMQTPGDCLANTCDGNGAIVAANDDLDINDDSNPCTTDACSGGTPTHAPVMAGFVCGAGQACDGAGSCSGCITAATCPGQDDECKTRTCAASVCGFSYTPAGTPTSAQTAADCKKNQCDGSGVIVAVADDIDIPVDSSQCTNDVCTAGVPSHPPLASGTACSQNGGTTCDGAGVCASASAPTDFLVLRVGDGTAALGSASTAGFLEHHNLDGTSAGATVSLPVAASGANKALTFAGSSTAEGGLSRSEDGHYVVVAGYAAAPGVSGIAATTSAANNRVIGRVAASGAVDTSTVFTTAFSAANMRAATSSDGTSFWASGSNSGVQYIQFGQSTATQINTAPTNIRFLHIFGGQLYGSSGSGTYTNVFTVGAGLPTTTGQTATSFAGMPTSTASPFSFVLLDLSATVAGFDTLYVADDRTVANGGGIQKWTFNGATWSLISTFTQGTTSFRGLAGMVTGANVTLLATSTLTSANTVVRFIDDGSAAPVGTVIATAPTNTAYRGIAFAPK